MFAMRKLNGAESIKIRKGKYLSPQIIDEIETLRMGLTVRVATRLDSKPAIKCIAYLN